MNLIKDINTIYHLVKGGQGGSHSERLESFYKNQAIDYDSFRQRLLPGRKELMENLEQQKVQGVWADFGAGTGSNLELIKVDGFTDVFLVDLSQSLLEQAEKRVQSLEINNAQLFMEDMTVFQPPKKLDLATFSYSLTMVPNWFGAINRAFDNLKKGSLIGVVDFYVSKKYPPSSLIKHSATIRHFWPLWFSWDDVYLSPDHLPYLTDKFETVYLQESTTSLPYLPWSRVPYYIFVGRKK